MIMNTWPSDIMMMDRNPRYAVAGEVGFTLKDTVPRGCGPAAST